MGSNSSQAFATRLSDDTTEQLEAILETRGPTASEIGRRAVRFSFDEDPNDPQESDPLASVDQLMAKMVK